MAAGPDFIYQVGKTLGEPAKDEKSGMHFFVRSVVSSPLSVVASPLSVVSGRRSVVGRKAP